MDRLNHESWKPYVDYIVEQAKELLAIDSPSGYGKEVSSYLMKELDRLGFRSWKTVKGSVMADLRRKKCGGCHFAGGALRYAGGHGS